MKSIAINVTVQTACYVKITKKKRQKRKRKVKPYTVSYTQSKQITRKKMKNKTSKQEMPKDHCRVFIPFKAVGKQLKATKDNQSR